MKPEGDPEPGLKREAGEQVVKLEPFSTPKKARRQSQTRLPFAISSPSSWSPFTPSPLASTPPSTGKPLVENLKAEQVVRVSAKLDCRVSEVCQFSAKRVAIRMYFGRAFWVNFVGGGFLI